MLDPISRFTASLTVAQERRIDDALAKALEEYLLRAPDRFGPPQSPRPDPRCAKCGAAFFEDDTGYYREYAWHCFWPYRNSDQVGWLLCSACSDKEGEAMPKFEDFLHMAGPAD